MKSIREADCVLLTSSAELETINKEADKWFIKEDFKTGIETDANPKFTFYKSTNETIICTAPWTIGSILKTDVFGLIMDISITSIYCRKRHGFWLWYAECEVNDEE